MRFYGNGIVWDAENNKRLIRFTDGVCETDDKRICSELKRMGFASDPIMLIDNAPDEVKSAPRPVAKNSPQRTKAKK